MKQFKILYFDDELKTAQPLSNSLMEVFGYNVNYVSKLSDFLTMLDSNDTFDLIILDIMAPIPTNQERDLFKKNEIEDMNKGLDTGVILFDRLRRIDKYKFVPVLIYTARSNVNNIIKENNVEILRKPELTITISNTIKKMLKDKI